VRWFDSGRGHLSITCKKWPICRSRAGRRIDPIVGALRDALVEHKTREGRDRGLVFGSSAETPLQPSTVWRRARTSWQRAGLEPIGLHEACTPSRRSSSRPEDAKAITTYMGHASIQTTYDLYGKLMPRSESEVAALVDAYLDGTDTAAGSARRLIRAELEA
jgi:integrase